MTEKTQDIDVITQELEVLRAKNSDLSESINELASRFQGPGWDFMSSFGEDAGITLDNLKRISEQLKDMTATHPLMSRGDSLLSSYIFGQGVAFPALPPRVQAKIDHPYNKASVFSTRAREELNRALFTDGNLFILRNTRTDILTRVPLNQITNLAYDEDSAERIHAVQRTWTHDGKQKTRWYFLNTYDGEIVTEIGNVEVDPDSVMYHEAKNRQVGWALGVPDALPAITWAVAYSEYLKNNLALVQAYGQLAIHVKQKTMTGVKNAAAQIQAPGQAKTGVTGALTDINVLPPAGSQVDFSNGRPVASYVASALNVSVVALLSDPGAAGSSYGAAQTLDLPTLRVMEANQDAWSAFLTTLIQDFGYKGADVVGFPPIETDAQYRQITTLTQMYLNGGIDQEEFRTACLAIVTIPGHKDIGKLPEPDAFNTGHVPGDEVPDPLASQGNSGSIPGGTNFDKNENRRDDANQP